MNCREMLQVVEAMPTSGELFPVSPTYTWTELKMFNARSTAYLTLAFTAAHLRKRGDILCSRLRRHLSFFSASLSYSGTRHKNLDFHQHAGGF